MSEIDAYRAALKTTRNRKKHVLNEEIVQFPVFPNELCMYYHVKDIIDASLYLKKITEIFLQNECVKYHHWTLFQTCFHYKYKHSKIDYNFSIIFFFSKKIK